MWTSVPDKATGDIFTEAMWDTYIRDNLNAGVPVLLADTTLGASAASITFSAINQTFTHLMIVTYFRSDQAAAASAVGMRFNGDTAANYDYQLLNGSGAAASAAEVFAGTYAQIGYCPGSTAAANLFSGIATNIPYYAQATNNKALTSLSAHKSGVATGNMNTTSWASFWRSSAAITSVTLLPGAGNFVAGSRATLYGMP